jgi:type VI secretion system protein ImpA
MRALDKISSYFERHEPSSPIPLLIERCKRLVSMNFLEIMGDLAPDGLKQASLAVGKRGDGK